MSQTNTTVIIDTGCANLNSVRYAFERLTDDVLVTDNHEAIKAADRVVLPGVGTAGAAMASLKNKQLIELIQGLTQPVLGVCLGMQMMGSLSKEQGGKLVDCECLGLIPTEVTELDSQGQPLPHMGWNQIEVSDHPLFDGIASGSYLYFVHSYRAPLSEYTIANSQYGETFSAAIAKDNFMGVQFHPEKSAAVGSAILKNFLALDKGSLNMKLQEAS
ncbi:imidazole glycerol phosphate synthase subunit HisH [Shewanella woodyi]|uniref:Imidazole glycerol phosphate synthase subunit HisH n=1 Tax=Shewanella woodyi (strain ATCC 51908 / MS32) TaxID=392500 RepID=B1KRG5_SHEWM|nr:imidazole glycerol phosphate synthase subunit HisH [Shewanella woodyi]ACA86372.1 imidazole glycerol phosphate synthase, glutamine amidotransferase subunit [Shewanella woodyi ATCC 51908]